MNLKNCQGYYSWQDLLENKYCYGRVKQILLIYKIYLSIYKHAYTQLAKPDNFEKYQKKKIVGPREQCVDTILFLQLMQ